MAHLFIRDPLVIFSELIDQDDTTSMDHFENIQSTNWQTVRFKPPPAGSNIGWRVEFRSMEVQLTDFENAAFAVFIVLLSRAILSFDLNLYLPISKVDENMQTAQQRGAAREQRFFFRKNVFAVGSSRVSSSANSVNEDGVPKPKEKKMGNCFPIPQRDYAPHAGSISDEYEMMTLEEIMLGKGNDNPGLIGLVEAYLDTLDVDAETSKKLSSYLDLIRRRSNGSLVTAATWIRNFVRSHPAYELDSVVNQEINYDLLVAVDEIERGLRQEPSLLPPDYQGGVTDQGSVSGSDGSLTHKVPSDSVSLFRRLWMIITSFLLKWHFKC